METWKLFEPLGIALGLGLLVGMQRQRTDSRIAGIRTFPLITLLGSLCALLAQTYGGWVLGVGLGAMALLILVGNLSARRVDDDAPGVTTEAAMLVLFVVGACLMAGYTAVAITVGGAVAVLLHLKPEMHALAAKIGDRDFKAVMQFALISLVILPVLPNRSFGPYGVLNPHKIWWMVVLIVGISLGGYLIYRFAGTRLGTLASGVLGGLVSSTATTVSLSRRTRKAAGTEGMVAMVILTASAIVFVRLALVIAATAPAFLPTALIPLGTMFGVLAVLGLLLWRGQKDQPTPVLEQENPTELKPALVFALLYGLVLVGIAAAKEYFGQQGLYAMAVISGLTDMDAITLSVTQMVNDGRVGQETGWRLILVASMSNLVFKGAMVAILGTHALLKRITLAFLVSLGVGAGLLWAIP